MGKQEYDFNLSVGISEILDKDSANEVERQVTRQKARMEEPVEIKLSVDEALGEYQRLEKRLKGLTQKLNSATAKADWSSISFIARDISFVETKMKSLARELQEQGVELQKNARLSKDIADSADKVGKGLKKEKDLIKRLKYIKGQIQSISEKSLTLSIGVDEDSLVETQKKVESLKKSLSKQQVNLQNFSNAHSDPDNQDSIRDLEIMTRNIESNLNSTLDKIKMKFDLIRQNAEIAEQSVVDTTEMEEIALSSEEKKTRELEKQTQELKEQNKERRKEPKTDTDPSVGQKPQSTLEQKSSSKNTQQIQIESAEDEIIEAMGNAITARQEEIKTIRQQVKALEPLSDYVDQMIRSSKEFNQLLANYNITDDAQSHIQDIFVDLITSQLADLKHVPGADSLVSKIFNILQESIVEYGSEKFSDQNNPLLLAQEWFRNNGKMYVDDETKATLGDEWAGIYKRNRRYLTRTPSPTAMGGDSYYENMWGMDEASATGLRPLLTDEDGKEIITRIDQTIKVIELMDKTLHSTKKELSDTTVNLTQPRNGEAVTGDLSVVFANTIAEIGTYIQHLTEVGERQAAAEMKLLRESKEQEKDSSSDKPKEPPRIIHQPTKTSDGQDFEPESFMPVELSRMIQILKDAIKHDPKSYFDFSKVNNTNDLNQVLSGGAFQIYSDDVQWTIKSVQLDSARTSANITSFNKELGLVLEQQYKLLQSSDDTVDDNDREVTITSESFDLIDAKLKFLPEQAKQYADEMQKATEKLRIANEKWLSGRLDKFNNLESKYRNSNERIDQSTLLAHPEATTLSGEKLTIQNLYDNLRSMFQQISDSTLKLTEQVKLDIDKNLNAYKTEGTNAYRISHTNTTFSQTEVDTAIREYNSIFDALTTSAKKNKVYDVLRPEFEKLRAILPEIGSDFSNVTKDTITNIVGMTRELRKSLQAAMGEQKFQEANQALTDNMRTANVEIETLSLKLKGMSETAPGIKEAAKAIEEMKIAQEGFQSATSFESRDTYESAYKKRKQEAQKYLEWARAGQQYEKKFDIPELNKYQEIYDVLIKVIPKINEYNAAILKAQQQDKGTGAYKKYIEALQSQLGIEINKLQTELNNPLITDSQADKMAFDLPNMFKNADGSMNDSILRFLTEAQEKGKLTTDQIAKLGETFKAALNIDAESQSRIFAMFDKSKNTIMELSDPNLHLNKDTEEFQKLQSLYSTILQFQSQLDQKGPTYWDPAQEQALRKTVSAFEEYANAIKKAVEYEKQYFAGKTVYDTGVTANTLDQATEKTQSSMQNMRNKLEEQASSFVKESFGDSTSAIFKKFTTNANGISTLDFSVLDKLTGQMQNFRMELGKFSTLPSIEHILGSAQESLQNKAGNQLDKLTALLQSANISKDSSVYGNAVAARDNLAQQLTLGGTTDDTVLSQTVKNAQLAYAALEKTYNKHVEYQRLIDSGSGIGFGDFDPKGDQIAQANSALDSYAEKLNMTVENAGKFNTSNGTMKATLRDSTGQIHEVTIAVDQFANRLVGIETGVRQGMSSWERFTNSLRTGSRQIMTALVGYNIFYKIIGEFRKGFGYVKEIDMAMTELRKVTDETESSYNNFLNTAAQTGAKIGSTISDFTNATADFARLGYDLNESTQMAEAAIVYKNVADGISSVDEATKSIISTIKAFNLNAEDSMSIADKFNEVGNNFAITSAGIGTALQKSASALFSAGNTIDESIALITAANSVVQNPEIVGTALKTLSLRIRGAKVELQDAGLETDNMATSVSKLQAKILALTHGKVNIMQDADTFKSTTQILREMASVWEEMTDIEQASALELLGGKRQANILSSILTNFDTVEQVISTSMGAEGSAMAENEKYLDSIKGKTDILKNSMQEMWNNTIDSEVVKSFMDLLNVLVKLIDKVGVFNVVLGGFIGRSAFKSKANIFTFNWKEATAGATTFGAKVANVGKSLNIAGKAGQLLTGVISGLVSMGISMAISLVISKLYEAAHAAENLKKEVSNLVTEYNNNYTELKNSLDKLTISSDPKQYENLADEFEILTRGVNEYGDNISLTADQYQRYADICELMVGINPDIANGYDSATEAINNNAGALTQLIELKQKEAMYNAQELVSDENLTKILEDKKNDILAAKHVLFELTDTNHVYDMDILELLDDEYEHIGNSFTGYGKANNESLMKSVLGTLGFTNDNGEIDKIISEYSHETGLEKKLHDFFMDYGDLIAENYDKFEKSDLRDWANKWNDAQRELQKLSIGMVNTLLEIPKSMEEYDDLSKGSKSFIAEWIKNNSDFKIDSTTTTEDILAYKAKVRDFVQDITDIKSYSTDIDGKTVSAQDILDLIFDFKTSNVDWGTYRTEIAKLIDHLWDAIGGSSNNLGFGDKGDLAVRLGINFEIDESNMLTPEKEQEMITRYAYVAQITEQEAKEYFNSLPATRVQRYLDLNWNLIDRENYKETMFADVKFDILDYADSIELLYSNVEKYKQALESLESGEFGMTDFIALIKEFPELAEGVDTSSKTFNGLYKNLKKAIKASPDPLIDDLKELSKSLKEAGKSSADVDDLIASIENMPTDAVENLEESYAGLAEQIRSARVAQNQLEKDMQDQKTGYETRSEALTKMEEFLKRGEIGSDSQMWDIADTYGFEFDFAKSVEENADALEHFIEVEKKYFKLNEEGQADFQGTKDFITDVEEALKSQGGLEGVTWEYNNGNPLIDFANKDFDKIVEALRKTDQFADLTADSFTEMLSQIARWFDFDWGDYDDKMDSFLAQQKQKYSEYYNGLTNGNFDYTKAQYKTAEEMAEKGWDIGEGNFATTFNSSVGIFDAEKQEHQVVLSVIGPDGEILSEKELSDYISNTLEGANNILEADKIENGGKGLIINDVIGSADDFDAEAFNEKIQKYKDMALQMHELEEYGSLKSGEVAKLYSNDIASFFNVQGEELDAVIKDFKQRYKDAVEIINDPTGIIQAFDLSEGVINTDTLKYLQNLSDVITISDSSNTIFANFDELTKMGQEAGYTDEQMNQLLDTIKKVNKNIVNLETSKEDPLGLNSLKGNASVLSDYLNALNVSNVLTPAQGSLQASVSIDIPSLAETMVNAGYTDEAIRSYMNSLPMDANTKLTIDGAEVNQEEIDAQLDTILVNVREQNSEIPVEVKVDSTQAQGALNTIIGLINQVHSKTVYIYAREKYIPDPNKPNSNNTSNEEQDIPEYPSIRPPRFMGNAFNRGNIGAKKSEDALVGELGQEMIVRGNQWFTVGDKGAEFTGIKRGDIIFNHKQTEELLRNGASKTRGKAFVSGTAYVHSHGSWDEKWDDRRNSGGNNQSTSTSRVEKAAEEFLEIFDWIEVRLEEINEQLDLHSAMVENAVGFGDKNAVIDEMLKISDSLHSNLIAGAQEYNRYANELLGKIPEAYREAAKNGKISIEEFRGEADEKTINAIKEYREWTQKVADLTQQLEELKTEIAELAKQKFDNIVEEFGHIVGIITKANDKLSSQIDLMENKGYIASKEYYEAMIQNSTKHQQELKREKELLQETLDQEVKNGNIEVGSDKWYEMIEQLYEIDNAIIDCSNDLEDYQNAINDIYWDNFDELINRLEYLEDETGNIIELMDQFDAVTKPDKESGWTDAEVQWTDEGLASLGLYAQQMEIAQYKSQKYGKAIEDLEKDYKDGKYSESEYLAKLNELTSAQYDSIQSYYDAKEAIRDLNNQRVEAIKEGIEKEIDAYSELIEKKKEELDAEKDLYDFQRSVADQQKTIADIERKLAALSVDNSASAIAQKKRLEAQLAEERQKLEDSYYDRSVENRQEALDKEMEDFENEKNDEMEKWDKYLENLDSVISDSLDIVKTHADEIYTTLNTKSEEFGIKMSDSITLPWKDGSVAISGYQDKFGTAMSETIHQLEKVTDAWQAVIDKMQEYAKIEIDKQNNDNDRYDDAKPQVPPRPSMPDLPQEPTHNGGSNGGGGSSAPSHAGLISDMPGMLSPGLRGENVRILQKTLNEMGFNAGAEDGIYGYNTKMAVFRFQQSDQYGGYIPTDGIVGNQTKNKFRIAGYALGSKYIPKNQLAMIDEDGLEEIVMHAGKDGRLEYLSKGSAVIPHDISENLMKLGKLDPTSVLDRNKPMIGLHPEIHNTEINIDSSIAELVHIDNCSTETLPDVEKIVNNAIEKHTQNLNNLLRRVKR